MTAASTLRIFTACGERMLAGDVGEPWDDATRDAVHRALVDRTDDDPALVGALTTARRAWRDGAAFRAWLDEVAARGG